MQNSLWWPEDPSDLATYTTMAASLATLLLFVISWRQLRLLRDQVRLASEETEAARLSAGAAQVSAKAAIESAGESTRARVDAYSPRLRVTTDPSPVAFVDASRSAMPGGGEPRLLDERSIHQSRSIADGEEFIFERDQHQFIWFKVSGLVRNEGTASARVRLDSEARFENSAYGAEIVLEPGHERPFTWAAGFTALKLAERRDTPQPAREFLIVVGMSYEDKGVVDHVYLELASRSLQEKPGHLGTYTFQSALEDAASLLTNVVVYPVQRTYRWDLDAGKIQPPPWPKETGD